MTVKGSIWWNSNAFQAGRRDGILHNHGCYTFVEHLRKSVLRRCGLSFRQRSRKPNRIELPGHELRAGEAVGDGMGERSVVAVHTRLSATKRFDRDVQAAGNANNGGEFQGSTQQVVECAVLLDRNHDDGSGDLTNVGKVTAGRCDEDVVHPHEVGTEIEELRPTGVSRGDT